MSSAFDVVKHFLGSVGGDVGDYLDKNREADKNLRENPSPGTAFDAAKQVVGGFLHLMGTGAKEVAYPVAGALAKEGQNPAAISPLRPGNLVRGPIGPVQVL